MDTISAIVEGELNSIKDQIPKSINVALRNTMDSFTVQSTKGRFAFVHIRAGTYRVYAGYQTLLPAEGDSIILGTGDISTLKLAVVAGRKSR